MRKEAKKDLKSTNNPRHRDIFDKQKHRAKRMMLNYFKVSFFAGEKSNYKFEFDARS
jgi:hypothetical protein